MIYVFLRSDNITLWHNILQ